MAYQFEVKRAYGRDEFILYGFPSFILVEITGGQLMDAMYGHPYTYEESVLKDWAGNEIVLHEHDAERLGNLIEQEIW